MKLRIIIVDFKDSNPPDLERRNRSETRKPAAALHAEVANHDVFVLCSRDDMECEVMTGNLAAD